jgi:hypothetical protein
MSIREEASTDTLIRDRIEKCVSESKFLAGVML